MTFLRRSLTLLTLCAVLGSPGFADEANLVLNMRDADIRSLIQWVADNTGRNVIVHRDVQGKVTVLSSKPLTADEAYQLFLSVLRVHGYAVLDTPEAIKILPADIAVQSGIPSSSGENADLVVTLFELKHASATAVAELLRPMLSKQAQVLPYPPSNTIIVAEHRTGVEQARRLIAQLDSRHAGEVELIRLKHANARDVLQALAPLLAAGSNGGGQDSGVNVSIDERSNSVLLTGESARRAQLRRLVSQLDIDVSGEGNTQVVYLHYVDAEEVAPILKSLAESMSAEEGSAKPARVSIESSKSANAVVINAPPAMLAAMKRVVEQIDLRRAQVLIEALVVEVSGDLSDDYGITWMSTDATRAQDEAGFGAVNALGDLGVGTLVKDSAGNPIGYQPGKGFTLGYFKNGNLQAAIRALEQTSQANILSTPTIVALDNEEASLLVGQNVPFITGQATSAASSTDDPFTTIERQDIGTTLVVTPRINRGDAITLQIKQTVENIAPTLSQSIAADLITNKREIITTALIQDDQILVLGGLIDDAETEVVEKVPVLGSLPLIGKLFSGTSKSRNKRNLMVFIRPSILKTDADAEWATRRRYEFMQDARRAQREGAKGGPARMEDYSTFSPFPSQKPPPPAP